MDNLTKSLLGKHNCVIQVRNEITKQLIIDTKTELDLQQLIKSTMASQVGRKLLEDKSLIFSSTEEDGNVVMTARIFAMTEDEIQSVIDEAFQAGVNSRKVDI